MSFEIDDLVSLIKLFKIVVSFYILWSKFWSEQIRVKDFLELCLSFILWAIINLLKFSAKFKTLLDECVFYLMNFIPFMLRFWIEVLPSTVIGLTLLGFFGTDGGGFDYEAPKLPPPLANGWFVGRVIFVRFYAWYMESVLASSRFCCIFGAVFNFWSGWIRIGTSDTT